MNHEMAGKGVILKQKVVLLAQSYKNPEKLPSQNNIPANWVRFDSGLNVYRSLPIQWKKQRLGYGLEATQSQTIDRMVWLCGK